VYSSVSILQRVEIIGGKLNSQQVVSKLRRWIRVRALKMEEEISSRRWSAEVSRE